MVRVPAPMCPCQDSLSYLRSDHMLVRFLIARQFGTWSFAGPATDVGLEVPPPSPTNPHQKWSFMFVHGRKLGLLCRILGGFLVETSETSGGMWRKRLQCWKATTGAPPIPDVTADGHIMMSSGFKLQTNHAAS